MLVADRLDALDFLLDPSSPNEFRDRYFEKTPLHVARNQPGYFDAVYDVAEVESSLFVGAAEYDKFILVKNGTDLPFAEWTFERRSPRSRLTGRPPKRVVEPRTVLECFDRGYTLVIKDASAFSLRLQKFVNRLQQRLGFYVQTNVYFTPPKAQGFEPHHDTHDTLVMQIEGTKVWRIYEPVVELPIETQPFVREEHQKQLRLNRQVTLNSGDTLYVPHGFPHEAESNDTRSLHVTLAFCPPRAIDLLEAMLDAGATTDVELRRSLPVGWHTSEEFAQQFAAAMQRRFATLFQKSNVETAIDVVLHDMFSVSRCEPGGIFEEWERFGELQTSSRVSLRDDTPYLVKTSGSKLALLIAGKCLTFPANYVLLFDRLESGPMTVAEVDALLPKNVGRALLKLLVIEGLISVG